MLRPDRWSRYDCNEHESTDAQRMTWSYDKDVLQKERIELDQLQTHSHSFKFFLSVKMYAQKPHFAFPWVRP